MKSKIGMMEANVINHNQSSNPWTYLEVNAQGHQSD